MSLRVTLKETANGLPATGCAGIGTGLATTGLPPSFIVLFDATGTSANEIANTAPTRPPRTRVGLAADLPTCLERLERIFDTSTKWGHGGSGAASVDRSSNRRLTGVGARGAWQAVIATRRGRASERVNDRERVAPYNGGDTLALRAR